MVTTTIIKGVLVFKEFYYHCGKCKIYLYKYMHRLLSCCVINHKAHTVQNLFNRIILCACVCGCYVLLTES
jgi:hypothetical protein